VKETITTQYPFRTCPRQVAVPERIACYSQIQFFDRLNRFNGLKRKIYYSIYRTNQDNNFDNVIIDSIAFDLDSDKSLQNLRKIYKYCEERDIKCMFVFSTGGFWAFIQTTANKLNFPKNALDQAQRKIAEEIGLTIGNAKDSDLDQSIIGDIARITRAINTKDINRKRFCINLNRDEIFNKTYEEICEIAQQPRFQYYTYGTELYDLTPLDESGYNRYNNNQSIESIEVGEPLKDVPIEIDIEKFLPCVQSWLTLPHKGVWNARYYFAVYCSQTLIPPSKCDELAKKYFGQQPRTDRLGNNHNHFKKDGVIRKAYKEEKMFPNCDTLMHKGLCPGKCKHYAGQNSPIYYKEE
jgi:hypothetical protein